MLATGERRTALAPLIIAVGAKPQDPYPYIDYAQTLLELKENPEEAVQALQQASLAINDLLTQLAASDEPVEENNPASAIPIDPHKSPTRPLHGTQELDNHTSLLHAHPNCGSREIYKGILDGRSHGVFNGKIYVTPIAQKTDAKQTNRAILLSDQAQIDTKPQLEIFRTT